MLEKVLLQTVIVEDRNPSKRFINIFCGFIFLLWLPFISLREKIPVVIFPSVNTFSSFINIVHAE
jgi:hypothetical protein